jgi:hypothetical protein
MLANEKKTCNTGSGETLEWTGLLISENTKET